MTNSMSLSTLHLWRSRHITSPQYVVKVCIPCIFWEINQKYSSQIHFLQSVSLFALFSTKKSASFSRCSMQSLDRILVDAFGEPRRGMCSFTGKKLKLRRRYSYGRPQLHTRPDLFSVYSLTEAPDSPNKGTLHGLQQAGPHRNHHFHRDDEVCKVASNRENPFRWWECHECSIVFSRFWLVVAKSLLEYFSL